MLMRISLPLVGAMLLLAGCRAPAPRPQLQTAAPSSAAAGVEIYQIDAAQSLLTLRVYREGPLADFGHNHIIAVHGLEGSIHWHQDPARSSLALRFPVAAMSVDDVALRAAAGADFAAEVSDSARNGTRANMLGPRLLDAEHYPQVTLQSERIGGSVAAPLISLRAYVAGHDALIEVPVHVERDAGGLRASGDIELKQTALGLTPFGIMFGALRVADAMSVHFAIVARPVAAGAVGSAQ
jgi:polyisoprenoid-binding protein YceI